MKSQPNLPGIKVANHSGLGKEFERDLIATHSQYEMRRIAKIDRHPSEWVFTGMDEYRKLASNPKTRGKVAMTADNRPMVRKATNVDFSGVACSARGKPGVHIKFDAKMTSELNAIPLGNFTEHQVDNLCISADCGAITGFMVIFYEILRPRVFFINALFVREKLDKVKFVKRAANGDGSISIVELESKGLEIPYSQRFVDWHPVLIK